MSAYQAYRGNQINTAGPLGLVLLSYDALYKSLGHAVHAVDGGDLSAEADHSARALEALIELSSSLDMDAGDDIAQDLSMLYVYMMKRVTDGMCTCSSEALEEVMRLVLTLREGWAELAESQAQPKSSAHPSSDVSARAPSRAPSTAYGSAVGVGNYSSATAYG